MLLSFSFYLQVLQTAPEWVLGQSVYLCCRVQWRDGPGCGPVYPGGPSSASGLQRSAPHQYQTRSSCLWKARVVSNKQHIGDSKEHPDETPDILDYGSVLVYGGLWRAACFILFLGIRHLGLPFHVLAFLRLTADVWHVSIWYRP